MHTTDIQVNVDGGLPLFWGKADRALGVRIARAVRAELLDS